MTTKTYNKTNMSVVEKWQNMMFSCRQACRILGEEFQEPEVGNWISGVRYHQQLWMRVNSRKHCPRCHSKLLNDNGTPFCPNCGELPPSPRRSN